MADRVAIHKLVAQVVYNRGYDGLDGLDPIRRLLQKDVDGSVAACLTEEMECAPEKVRGGLAFLLGARYLEIGDLVSIGNIYEAGDKDIATGVLGSLTGATSANRTIGSAVVVIAIEGASHPAQEVRAAACSVLMNQCAWGVDVSAALRPMMDLLQDADSAVRQGLPTQSATLQS